MIRQEDAAEGLVEHQPDYGARVDHGTSYELHCPGGCGYKQLLMTYNRNFSPIPKRVMDGSEPHEITPAAVLSGAPVDLQGRTVR